MTAMESDGERAAVQTLRDCRASSNLAERLKCGVFTAAFRRRYFAVTTT